MDLSKPQKFETCRGQTLFYVPAISRAFFFCILMIFIDFQFYIQFYYSLLSLTHTHTPLHHLFYIVNNFFLTYTYSSGTIAHYCTLYLPHFIL